MTPHPRSRIRTRKQLRDLPLETGTRGVKSAPNPCTGRTDSQISLELSGVPIFGPFFGIELHLKEKSPCNLGVKSPLFFSRTTFPAELSRKARVRSVLTPPIRVSVWALGRISGRNGSILAGPGRLASAHTYIAYIHTYIAYIHPYIHGRCHRGAHLDTGSHYIHVAIRVTIHYNTLHTGYIHYIALHATCRITLHWHYMGPLHYITLHT